ncbi:DNAase [Photobacterium nomapromontoriensis]|uniref:DNAase n=1 Tax=Photobacterium nomapromontoriensis TaxID=2910237 RepID=UPI003D0BD143
MGLFKIMKDGFRGKPDFSSLRTNTYQIDDLLFTLSIPHNVTSGEDYYHIFQLIDFTEQAKVDDHETVLRLAYSQYYFNTKIINPLYPINSPGSVFVCLKLKKSNINVKDIKSLSDFLEKNYFEYYHDRDGNGKSCRGLHTYLMNEAYDFAKRCWGEEPENQDEIKEKKEFILDSFLRAYPPIKCEEVKIENNIFSKYNEGHIDKKNKYSRLYNLPLKDEYFLSIEFHYDIEATVDNKKFREWVRHADETFERLIMQTVDVSRVVDSVIDMPIQKIGTESH